MSGCSSPFAGEMTCQTCLRSFVGRKRRYCSPRCREQARQTRRHQRTGITCEQCGRLRKNPRGGHLCVHCARTQRTLRPCPRCSTPFWPWADGVSHARKYCSPTCATPPAKPKPTPYREARECARCLGPFVANSPTRRHCSKRCQLNAKARRRKALKRTVSGGDPADPSLRSLHRRDQGVCGICGTRVDATVKWPDPSSASVDHIVPLSLGGRHDGANMQLAHLGCNLAKGTTPPTPSRFFAVFPCAGERAAKFH